MNHPSVTQASSYNTIVSFLLGVHVASSIVSQSLVDISLFFIAALLVVFFLKSRSEFDGKLHFPMWPILGYVVIVILGYLVNGTFAEVPWDSIRKFIWILNLVILYWAFKNFKIKVQVFLMTLAVLALIPSVYSLITFFYEYDFMTKVSIQRIVGLVNSATYHAHGGALVFTVLVGLHLVYKRAFSQKQNIFLYAVEVLLLASIFLTFTRGIWVALMASSVVILFLYRLKHMVFLVLFLTAMATAFSFTDFKFLKERVQNATFVGNKARMDLLKVNWQIFKEYPVLGIGYGENLRRNREYWDRPEWNKPSDYITSHAHNQFLNVLATTGILGFIFFMIFYVRFSLFSFRDIVVEKIKNFRLESNRTLLLAISWMNLEFIFSCVTDVTFEYAKIRAVILVIWALGLVVEKKSDDVFQI